MRILSLAKNLKTIKRITGVNNNQIVSAFDRYMHCAVLYNENALLYDRNGYDLGEAEELHFIHGRARRLLEDILQKQRDINTIGWTRKESRPFSQLGEVFCTIEPWVLEILWNHQKGYWPNSSVLDTYGVCWWYEDRTVCGFVAGTALDHSTILFDFRQVGMVVTVILGGFEYTYGMGLIDPVGVKATLSCRSPSFLDEE